MPSSWMPSTDKLPTSLHQLYIGTVETAENRAMAERRWEELNFDCLVSIFSKLGLEDLTTGVPLVCKSWHVASLDPQCWKTLDFHDLDFTSNSKCIARFKQEYGIPNFSFASFMKLSISRSHGSAVKLSIPSTISSPLHQDLILASIECPRLKELALPTLLRQDDRQIPGLMARWKDLEILEMKWKPLYFLELVEEIRANCPKFTGFHLCGYFDGKDAKAIVECLPKLRSLNMSGSFVKRDDLVMILEGCRELQDVDVSRCRGFDAEDEILKKASSGIKKFVCEGSKVQENYVTSYCNYANLFSAFIFGDY
ncbi:F-box/LRR-repeat protein At3g48880-like [Phalaenopsis equestris]|uniref:F-box/LRR-repeat protein At3g48880-like n=1 Tax=Phalaenopsis equestris TaxID=78828 RepID=UPI0009E2B2F2|nr:F-box/LRR-repeat protein At3g48880-like [Phalaenopsis equestris]